MATKKKSTKKTTTKRRGRPKKTETPVVEEIVETAEKTPVEVKEPEIPETPEKPVEVVVKEAPKKQKRKVTVTAADKKFFNNSSIFVTIMDGQVAAFKSYIDVKVLISRMTTMNYGSNAVVVNDEVTKDRLIKIIKSSLVKDISPERKEKMASIVIC